MLFNSFQFAVFFVAVLVALRVVPWRVRMRALLGASLIFYAMWIPSYLVLLLGTLLANYLLVVGMQRSHRPRLYLVASIILTLGLLGVFKYATLAVETALPLLRLLSSARVRPVSLLLPLGISFYSFEIISLSVDIYRGRLPCPDFGRYVLFVTFFPHLIAGPIMRGDELLPQLLQGGDPNPQRTRRGAWLLASGLAKKAIFADYLLAPFVNDIFAEPGAAGAPVHLLAIYSFAFQIYYDFSGYTDMARGLACMMGFELPHNFLEPYLSQSASEFWRRWHISLSRWLRDYLYIPLGGNKHGGLRTGLNVMATMLLGGLWHGAGWNYVVWGGLHGLLLILERLLGWRSTGEGALSGWREALRVVVTFHAVCLIWVAFRAPTLDAAVAVWKALLGSYRGSWPMLPLLIVVLCAALHLAERRAHALLPALHAKLARAAWGPLFEGGALGLIVTAAIAASGAGAEFIYFQF